MLVVFLHFLRVFVIIVIVLSFGCFEPVKRLVGRTRIISKMPYNVSSGMFNNTCSTLLIMPLDSNYKPFLLLSKTESKQMKQVFENCQHSF